MKVKKLCSFDAWGTLIKGNPDFKSAQNELAKKLFNFSEDKFQTRKTNIKKIIDSNVESYGLHYDRRKIYAEIFQTTSFSTIDFFITESDKLFLEFPPIQINELVTGITSVISSNTVLIYGDTLYKVIRKYFGPVFCNFSDVLRLSKPRKEMFTFTEGKVLFHVGDNPKTDGACEHYGIKFIPIEKYSDFKSTFKYY
jgi:FMN phosphatase YigB (HAD superfamily)